MYWIWKTFVGSYEYYFTWKNNGGYKIKRTEIVADYESFVVEQSKFGFWGMKKMKPIVMTQFLHPITKKGTTFEKSI